MPRDRVVCVGNAALDRTFAVSGPVHMATSNLARGIDVSGVMRSPVHPAAEYAAIIDAGNELVIAASATAAIDALTIGMLGAAFDEDARTAWTFADCTLPAPVIGALLEDRVAGGPPLAIDAVSIAKAERLPRDLSGLDLLFLNLDEAVEIAVPPARPVDVTGAGDALVAGTLYGLLAGDTLPRAVQTGILVARLAIEAPETVSRALCRAAVEALRGRLVARA